MRIISSKTPKPAGALFDTFDRPSFVLMIVAIFVMCLFARALLRSDINFGTSSKETSWLNLFGIFVSQSAPLRQPNKLWSSCWILGLMSMSSFLFSSFYQSVFFSKLMVNKQGSKFNSLQDVIDNSHSYNVYARNNSYVQVH